MSKSPGAKARIGLTFGLASSLALLGTTSEKPKPIQHQLESSPFTPRIQALTSRVLWLANQSPSKTEDKPPYSVHFTVPTENGDSLTFSVQTATPALDVKDVNQLNINQASPHGQRFAINLSRLGEKWNASCTNDVAVAGSGWVETEENTVFLGFNSVLDDPLLARVILSNTIESAQTVTDSVNAGKGSLTANPPLNTCRFNVGGG